MANRRKLFYVARFVVLCWLAIGVVIGVVIGLARILNNTTLTIIVVQVLMYSCFFGFIGWQLYKRGEYKILRFGKNNRGWGDSNSAGPDDLEENENGWK